jgi:two-component sensor histidine kinase
VVIVREPDATRQPTPHDIQLMSKRRVLGLKPQLRLEWRGQDGQNKAEQPDHSASLGDSITSSTRIRFSVHTAGFGLGLSIARSIVLAHGGELSLNDRQPHGLIVRIELPLHQQSRLAAA